MLTTDQKLSQTISDYFFDNSVSDQVEIIHILLDDMLGTGERQIWSDEFIRQAHSRMNCLVGFLFKLQEDQARAEASKAYQIEMTFPQTIKSQNHENSKGIRIAKA